MKRTTAWIPLALALTTAAPSLADPGPEIGAPPSQVPLDFQALEEAARTGSSTSGVAAAGVTQADPTGSSPAQTFTPVGNWPFGPSRAVAVDGARNLIFLGAGGAVLTLDGTDRTNPVFMNDDIRSTGVVTDMFYEPSTQRLYMACGEAGLDIWDVSSPSSPALLSRTPILYCGFATPVSTVFVTGHYAAMNCRWG